MAQLKQLLIASSVLVAGLTLSACGNSSAIANARQACHEVKIALATQKKSEAPGLSVSEVDVFEICDGFLDGLRGNFDDILAVDLDMKRFLAEARAFADRAWFVAPDRFGAKAIASRASAVRRIERE